MKLLSDPQEIQQQFKTLMQNYKEYHWAIAWADFNFDLSKLLVDNQGRINKIIVGLSFYATHPDFLMKFYGHGGVKFITNESNGTFHPKLYLFKNSDADWKLLIGSGNFKKSAFEKNTEVFTLVSSADKSSKKFLKHVNRFIETQWRLAVFIEKDFVSEYSEKKKKVRQHHPSMPRKGISRPIYDLNWGQYLNELKDYPKKRIALLNWVKNQFKSQPVFHKMDEDTRQAIAGFGATDEDIEFELFGTTGTRGYFKNVVNENPELIDNALKAVPKTGAVTETHYREFIRLFTKVSRFKELACITRLLCLWRPDYFVTVNKKNISRLSRALHIKKKITLENYWQLVVAPILTSEWTSDYKASSEREKILYKYRVALLDCISYEE